MIAVLRFSITEINLGFSVQIALVISSEEEEILSGLPFVFFLSFHPSPFVSSAIQRVPCLRWPLCGPFPIVVGGRRNERAVVPSVPLLRSMKSIRVVADLWTWCIRSRGLLGSFLVHRFEEKRLENYCRFWIWDLISIQQVVICILFVSLSVVRSVDAEYIV